MIKVKLYTDEEYDITSYITSDIRVQSRKDLVFGEGSFTMTTDVISYNIPPYSLLIIEHENHSEDHYVACSEAHYDSINKVWNHDVRLLDATSILATWIIDSKSFSTTGTHKKTYQQMAICCFIASTQNIVLLNLNNNPIGNYIDIANDNFSMMFNQEIEKSLPNGSNLWTALCVLANDYNKIPKVTFKDVTSAYDVVFNIDFVDREETYRFFNKNIIDEGFYQNENEYCNSMVSALTDVVDRTTINRFEGLVCKAESSIITDKSAYLEIPCKVERVTKLEIAAYDINFGQYSIDFIGLTSDHGISELTWSEWKNNYHQNEIGPLLAKLNELGIVVPNDARLVKTSEGAYDNWNLMFALPNKVELQVLEKSQWDILEEKEKPKYCYYQKYNNKIENLYSPYRTDLWNSIISVFDSDNGTTKGVLDAGDARHFTFSGSTTTCELKIQYSFSDKQPTSYSYNVECIPMVSMYIKDTKPSTDILNERRYKYSSITYNGVNGMVDFDRVVNDIKKTNLSRGRTQRTLTLVDTTSIPKAGYTFNRDGVVWYISSSTTTYDKLGKMTHVLECSLTPIKVAEAVGLMTQYESTPNPMESCIDRHIYTEINPNNALNLSSGNIVILFTFNLYNGEKIKVLKRPAKLAANGKVYLVVEALDNYAMDTYSVAASNSSTVIKRYMQDAKYVDDNNEVESFEYKIISVNNITKAQAYNFVNQTFSDKQPIWNGNKTIYKDARERLIFTFCINQK